MLNPIDQSILSAFNSFAGKSYLFDRLVEFVSSSEMLQGIPFAYILWAYWFRGGDADTVRRTRGHVVCTVVAGTASIAVARGLALSLPFRIRPRFNPAVHFNTPAGWGTPDLIDWSSFPSDHAVLFAALATGLLFVSRRVGFVALGYVGVFIGLPRVYLGIHYPTDVLAGMLLGVVIGYIFNFGVIGNAISRSSRRFETAAPHLFYPVLFYLSVQIATLFDDVRRTLFMLSNVVHHFW